MIKKARLVFLMILFNFLPSKAQDTTIIFPDGVSLILKKDYKNAGSFIIDQKQVKILNRQIKFLKNALQVHESTELLYQKNELVIDSINGLNEQKVETEYKRADNYKKGFEELESVNNQYNIQLESCKSDLINCATDLKKSNRRKFWYGLKGVIIGVAAGTLIGILISR